MSVISHTNKDRKNYAEVRNNLKTSVFFHNKDIPIYTFVVGRLRALR